MVFGKTKKSKDKNKNDSDKGGDQTSDKKTRRSRKSYRRPTPKQEDITDIVDYPLTKCPDCGSFLERLKTIIRYAEDIRLPNKIKNFLKKTEKQKIQTGYCPCCRERVSAIPIQKQKNLTIIS